jgi:hypothetical protein
MTENRRRLFVIVIDGPMGAGKTTTSKLLHEQLGGTARITLAEIKRLISGHTDEEDYGSVSQEVIMGMVEGYLTHGISCIVEWGMEKDRVEAIKSLAEKHDAQCFIYQLSASRRIRGYGYGDSHRISVFPDTTDAHYTSSTLPTRGAAR